MNNASGTIEAIGGTLSISTGAVLTNSGLLEAASNGVLDFTTGVIHNNGTDPLASSNATGILLDGTLEIDNPLGSSQMGSLSFGGNGLGVVALVGGTIEGNSSNAETLNNVNNLIEGYGQIGLGTDQLTVQNQSGGVIDANVSGHGPLAINAGANVIGNAGLMEATGGGSLAIDSSVNNSHELAASDGGILALSNLTVDNTGTIDIDGSVLASQMQVIGTVVLDGGNGTSTGPGQLILDGGFADAILSNLHAATLTNDDNTISGSGSVGDAFLTLQNEQYGVVDATGVLALNAVSTVNSGLLEATSGGTLQITGSVTNSGLIEANGGTVYVGVAAAIGGSVESVTITNGGTAEFVGSSVQSLTLNAVFSGTGTLKLDNPAQFDGHISGFGTSGDTLDLAGFDAAHDTIQVTTGSGSYDSATNITALLVTDEHTGSSATLNLTGDYSTYNWAATTDGHGGADIAPVVQPPTANSYGVVVQADSSSFASTAIQNDFGAERRRVRGFECHARWPYGHLQPDRRRLRSAGDVRRAVPLSPGGFQRDRRRFHRYDVPARRLRVRGRFRSE